jgi:hypothetical protein
MKRLLASFRVSKSSVSLWVRDMPRPERLSYEECRKRADIPAAERFWLAVTGAEPGRFLRSALKRHNPKTVRKNVGDNYHGCLRIDVRGSAELYRWIEG